MRKFFTRINDKSVTDLYVRVHSRNPKIDFVLNTKISVDVLFWNKYGGDLQKMSKTKEGKNLFKLIQETDNAIDTALSVKGVTADKVREAVYDVTQHDAREKARTEQEIKRQEREEERIRKQEEKAKKESNVCSYLSDLIERMKTGEARISTKGKHSGEKYTTATIKKWNTILGILKRFNKNLVWDAINKRQANKFLAWLESEGYMDATRNKVIRQVIALIHRAEDEGKHHNTTAAKAFAAPTIKTTTTDTEIYLSADELDALYNMKLSGLKENVRDIFLLGCFLCQRISDYNNLKEESFTTTAKGNQVVKLTQQKTGNDVVIPLLSPRVYEIAKKYNFQIPHVNEQVFNRYLKEILKTLSADVPSLAVTMPTELNMKERAKESKAREEGKTLFQRDEQGRVIKPRWAMVASHTARRTGITLMYLSGRFGTMEMMAVSGHRDPRAFKQYIKLSNEDFANEIADKLDGASLF